MENTYISLSVKDHNITPGRERQTFKFEESLDELLLDRHDTQPFFVMSLLESTPSTSSGCNTEEPEDTSDSSKQSRKEIESSAAKVMQFLN
jgi:hypothetical protein